MIQRYKTYRVSQFVQGMVITIVVRVRYDRCGYPEKQVVQTNIQFHDRNLPPDATDTDRSLGLYTVSRARTRALNQAETMYTKDDFWLSSRTPRFFTRDHLLVH